MSTVDDRYEVGFDDELLDTFSKRGDAFRCAAYHAMKMGRPVGVFDRMARPNGPCRWEFGPDGSCEEVTEPLPPIDYPTHVGDLIGG